MCMEVNIKEMSERDLDPATGRCGQVRRRAAYAQPDNDDHGGDDDNPSDFSDNNSEF